MIPKNIKREHIIKAIEEIKRVGIPEGRSSKKFLLEYNGKFYPPKYALSLANKYANGKELYPQEFGGGEETNNFLKDLGFNILEASNIPVFEPLKEKSEIEGSITHHDERCQECKETIRKLLRKIYGKVEQNYKFEIGVHPDDFKNTSHYEKLKSIYEALQEYRGFKEFIKSKTLPNCDFFVPNLSFILEFDEMQHFTLPREITLRHYPEELKLGFDRKRWMKLCREINAKDNDPPYRDEQRAWYDTLRDFLPAIRNLKPTIRLFSRDFVWCSLNPDNACDVEKFKNILKVNSNWEIEIKEDPKPFLARIIIAADWDGKVEDAKKVLDDIYKRWPMGRRVKFLITCGGFIQFDWPNDLSRRGIGDNTNPNSEAVDILIKKAEEYAKLVLGGGLDKKLKEITDYVTLGIDSYKEKISITKNYIGSPHIELVSLIDLRRNSFHWTGKSYPTLNQQKGLVRISDLETHFFNLDIGKVMILGCHDLTIFNPRSNACVKGWRKKVNEEFRKMAEKQKPTIVLQHPHTTDSTSTWNNAWKGLRKALPTVEKYASAGRYWNKERAGGQQRSKLDDVLKETKSCNTIDLIVCRKADL